MRTLGYVLSGLLMAVVLGQAASACCAAFGPPLYRAYGMALPVLAFPGAILATAMALIGPKAGIGIVWCRVSVVIIFAEVILLGLG